VDCVKLKQHGRHARFSAASGTSASEVFQHVGRVRIVGDARNKRSDRGRAMNVDISLRFHSLIFQAVFFRVAIQHTCTGKFQRFWSHFETREIFKVSFVLRYNIHECTPRRDGQVNGFVSLLLARANESDYQL